LYIKQEVKGFFVVNDAVMDPSFKGLYLWDPTALSGTGDYVVVNNLEGDPNLASGQGFFIKAVASGGNVEFNQEMQVHQSTALFKLAQITWPNIRLTAKSSGLESTARIYFNEGMSTGLDPYFDAGILKSASGLNIYSLLVSDNGVDFSIQALPGKLNDTYIIPIGVDALNGGEITFSATTLNLPQGYVVVLEDRLTKSFTDLKGTDSKYTATVAADSKVSGRFYLLTGASQVTGMTDLKKHELSVYRIGQTVYIQGNVDNNALFSIYSTDGRILKQSRAVSEYLNNINITGLPQGIYLLNVRDKNQYKPVKFVVSDLN
jgi:hypothetical protein